MEIPARYPSYTVALLSAWMAAWAAAVIFIALGWLGVIAARVPPVPVWIVFVLVFMAAGAFVAWHLAWVLRGREVVELKDGALSISRGIGPWRGRPMTFPWSGVRDLRTGSFRRDVIYPSWGRRFVGKGDAYLTFTSGGREHHFARGLSQVEAGELVELLRARASDELE